MNETKTSQYRLYAAIIKAASHPTRLFIIEELNKRDHCVCELTTMVGCDMSTISKHLSVLHQAGIVDSTKEGTRVIYSLSQTSAHGFAQLARDIWKTNIKMQRDAIGSDNELDNG